MMFGSDDEDMSEFLSKVKIVQKGLGNLKEGQGVAIDRTHKNEDEGKAKKPQSLPNLNTTQADDDDCDLLFGMFGVDDLDDEKENQPLQRPVPQRSSQKSKDQSKSEGGTSSLGVPAGSDLDTSQMLEKLQIRGKLTLSSGKQNSTETVEEPMLRVGTEVSSPGPNIAKNLSQGPAAQRQPSVSDPSSPTISSPSRHIALNLSKESEAIAKDTDMPMAPQEVCEINVGRISTRAENLAAHQGQTNPSKLSQLSTEAGLPVLDQSTNTCPTKAATEVADGRLRLEDSQAAADQAGRGMGLALFNGEGVGKPAALPGKLLQHKHEQNAVSNTKQGPTSPCGDHTLSQEEHSLRKQDSVSSQVPSIDTRVHHGQDTQGPQGPSPSRQPGPGSRHDTDGTNAMRHSAIDPSVTAVPPPTQHPEARVSSAAEVGLPSKDSASAASPDNRGMSDRVKAIPAAKHLQLDELQAKEGFTKGGPGNEKTGMLPPSLGTTDDRSPEKRAREPEDEICHGMKAMKMSPQGRQSQPYKQTLCGSPVLHDHALPLSVADPHCRPSLGSSQTLTSQLESQMPWPASALPPAQRLTSRTEPSRPEQGSSSNTAGQGITVPRIPDLSVIKPIRVLEEQRAAVDRPDNAKPGLLHFSKQTATAVTSPPGSTQAGLVSIAPAQTLSEKGKVDPGMLQIPAKAAKLPSTTVTSSHAISSALFPATSSPSPKAGCGIDRVDPPLSADPDVDRSLQGKGSGSSQQSFSFAPTRSVKTTTHRSPPSFSSMLQKSKPQGTQPAIQQTSHNTDHQRNRPQSQFKLSAPRAPAQLPWSRQRSIPLSGKKLPSTENALPKMAAGQQNPLRLEQACQTSHNLALPFSAPHSLVSSPAGPRRAGSSTPQQRPSGEEFGMPKPTKTAVEQFSAELIMPTPAPDDSGDGSVLNHGPGAEFYDLMRECEEDLKNHESSARLYNDMEARLAKTKQDLDQMLTQTLELRVQTAIAGNRLIRLDNPIVFSKLQSLHESMTSLMSLPID